MHILLLAEKEHGSCRGREGRPPLVHRGLLDKLSIYWGLLLKPLYLLEVQSKFPRQWFWHCLGSLQWWLQTQPLCREEEPGQGHLHPPILLLLCKALHWALLFLQVLLHP